MYKHNFNHLRRLILISRQRHHQLNHHISSPPSNFEMEPFQEEYHYQNTFDVFPLIDIARYPAYSLFETHHTNDQQVEVL